MNKSLILSIPIFALFSIAFAADAPDCRLVPGWEQSGPARSFEPDNLYEYVDGDAEGFLIYGFVRMQNVTCTSGDDSMVMDVSEMTDADAAYGIFTSRRDPNRPVASIGMGGQILPLRATFAKDKYYVEISASSDKESTTSLQAFVTAIERRIEGRTSPPETLDWFPSEKLVSVRMVPQSVLGLHALKRGYVARYEEGKAFIVTEESPASAALILKKVQARFGHTTIALIADEAFQVRDQYLGGLCLFRKGRYLAGYSNSSTAEEAVRLATALSSRLP